MGWAGVVSCISRLHAGGGFLSDGASPIPDWRVSCNLINQSVGHSAHHDAPLLESEGKNTPVPFLGARHGPHLVCWASRARASNIFSAVKRSSGRNTPHRAIHLCLPASALFSLSVSLFQPPKQFCSIGRCTYMAERSIALKRQQNKNPLRLSPFQHTNPTQRPTQLHFPFSH